MPCSTTTSSSSVPGPPGRPRRSTSPVAGARVLLAERARFPRDKPCGGGVTGRALRQAPCDITPVVERVVHTFELRLHYRRSFRRTSGEPLILMTQRRRLDAYLAEQAVAAGASFRDNARVDQVEIGADGVEAMVGGVPVAARLLVGADGANGVVAKAAGLDAGIVRGVALEGNVPWHLLDPDRYSSTAVIEFGAPAGGYGWLFPKGDHANLGVGGWALEGPRLTRAPLAPRPRLLRRSRGDHRRSRASPADAAHRRLDAGERQRAPRRGRRRARRSPVGGRDVRGVRIGAPGRRSDPRSRPPAVSPKLSRRRSIIMPARRGPRSARSTAIPRSASGRLGRPGSSASSPACSGEMSGTRTRRRASPALHCG